MATLGGDMLRMLAHTLMQTGANVGTGLLNNYLTEQAKEKLLGTTTALEAAQYETNPEKQQEILGQLKGRLNLPTVTEKGFVPQGEIPTAANLGQRTILTYPSETYAPAALERIVAPPVTDTAKALAVRANPALAQLSPEMALAYKLKDPDRELKELMYRGQLGEKMATREQQAIDREAGRQNQLQIAQLMASTRETIAAPMMLIAKQNADTNLMNANLNREKLTTIEERRHDEKLSNLYNNYKTTLETTRDVFSPALIEAANNFNQYYDTIKTKNPNVAAGYSKNTY